MSIKHDLATNYLDRLRGFDPEEDSVQVLESARRFIRDYDDKAVDPEVRALINQIHDQLEVIVKACILRTDIKPAFSELARKYDMENKLASERIAPTVKPIDKRRLTLVENYDYDSSLYDNAEVLQEPAEHAPGGSPGEPEAPQLDPGDRGLSYGG